MPMLAQKRRVFGSEHWLALAERADADAAGWARAPAPIAGARRARAYVKAAHDDPTPLLLSHRDSDKKNFMRTPASELISSTGTPPAP
jgi:hypothetical protein